MTDHDIEQMLRRHRPAGPPPELRARIFQPAPDEGRLWPWAAAAAALLATTIGFHAASASLRSKVPVPAGTVAVDDRERLIEALGGDDIARARAEFMIAEQALLVQAVPAAQSESLEEQRR